ncbi:GP46-like surface antigen, putative [Bodo saltans]|uniref:GP46-like surface antigen, putative n=1 Tax=Bodo saltans TaxID=75058 RepID=A0A0S4IMZ0_BODSA|nr:GP46-like surface antigen, putative [Bodo saltans]|eukprot:CUF55967.1 GP46-like surface antigen, putative [Bodo saltans]
MTNLDFFSVGWNMIHGSLPQEYRAWTKLSYFAANNNSLGGTLPLEYASMTQLRTFMVEKNFISGTIHQTIQRGCTCHILTLTRID